MTTSLKRKTIRRFKRQSSDGYLTQKTTQNLKIMFKMNRRFKKINMFQTLPPWQTDFDLVFKSQKTYQKILRRFLITISTSLTLISFLNQLTCIKRLVLSTSLLLSYPHNLKRQCLNFKRLFFYPASKTYLHPAWISLILMSNSLLKSK